MLNCFSKIVGPRAIGQRLPFPNWRSAPRDLALYDRQLLIAYDDQANLLSFDVISADSDIPQLFNSIDQLAAQGLPVLHKLEP